MKTGTDSPVKTGLAILLGIAAIFYVARWVMGSNETQKSATTSAVQIGKKGQINSLDPILRTDLLRDEEETQYQSKGRNIFVLQAELPKTITPPITTPNPTPIYSGPPPPPPINLKFFGFANKAGEPRKIFLSRGEDIWVAKEGEVVDRRYKVVKINSTSVEIEDVLSNNRQSIPLTQS
jgi:hypothetical protein